MRQVALLLDVLQEMAPLAAYREAGDAQPVLLRLLARVLAPGTVQPAVLDTPASQQAFLQLVSGLCGREPAAAQGKAAAAGAAGGSKEPLLSPAAVLRHAVAPALQAGDAAEGLLLPLQVAELLIGGQEAAASGSAALQQTPLGGVRPVLQALLSLDARRIDRSAAALQASLEAYEQAASILQRCGSDAPTADAGSYFRRQLQTALPAAAHGQPGAPQPQQVQQLRQRMVQLLAALLPCLTAAEAAEVLRVALPAAIQTALLPGAAGPQASGHGILPGVHAAAVEAACRAALALALQPAQAPVAGEEPAAGEVRAAGAPPSALRQVAVERLLQHLTQHCARLATPSPAPSPAAAGGPPSAAEGPQLQLGPGDAQALGLRCFRELAQLAAAVYPAGYDCAALQAGLLQLARQLARPGAQEAPHEAPAAALLPAEAVQQQLAAAAALLPEGRLRDVVLLGVERAAAD